jgi:hypothetical protein
MDEEPKYQIMIFYEGTCGICRKEIEHYRAKDKNANHPNFDPKIEASNPEKFWITPTRHT